MSTFVTQEITFEDIEQRLSTIIDVCGTDTEDRIYESLTEMFVQRRWDYYLVATHEIHKI